MKTTNTIIKKLIKEEVQNIVSEIKYQKLNSIVQKCVNEAFDEYDNTDNEEEAIDFHTFETICSRNGWEWYDSFEVHNPEGQTGVRYLFSKGDCQFDELVKQIKESAKDPNGIISGVATHKYAPEIKHPYIIVLFV